MATKRSWQEKLRDSKGLPKCGPITGKMARRWGGETMVIPAPLDVDALMRRVPKGKLTTINEIRQALALRHGVSIACPMTTGIFAWIAAHAAEEQREAGRAKITPYWRTLKTGGVVNEKYPGGAARQRKILAAEGHRIVRKGKRLVVADFEKALLLPGRFLP